MTYVLALVINSVSRQRISFSLRKQTGSMKFDVHRNSGAEKCDEIEHGLLGQGRGLLQVTAGCSLFMLSLSF